MSVSSGKLRRIDSILSVHYNLSSHLGQIVRESIRLVFDFMETKQFVHTKFYFYPVTSHVLSHSPNENSCLENEFLPFGLGFSFSIHSYIFM